MATDAVSKNLPFIDEVKGVLIFLVVFGHVWRALFNNGILTNEALFNSIDSWIYAFHMPGFFFVAGIFALKSADRPLLSFIGRKIRTIVYPYFIWSIVQTALQIFMSGSTTHKVALGDLLNIVHTPINQFWFLYSLFFIFIIFIVLKQISSSPLFFLALAAAYFVVQNAFPEYPLSSWGNSGKHFLFFSAGIACSKAVLSLANNQANIRSSMLVGATLIMGVLTLVPVFYGPASTPPNLNILLATAFAIPGIIFVFLGTYLFQKHWNRFSDFVALMGRYSLEIYCLHVISAAGFRIALQKTLHINDLPLHAIGGTLAGVLIPILIVHLANARHIRYLFVWPERNKAYAQ